MGDTIGNQGAGGADRTETLWMVIRQAALSSLGLADWNAGLAREDIQRLAGITE